MKERLDSEYISQLADEFLEIAKKFNDYRFEKISQQKISHETFLEMGKKSTQLMKTAREMKLLSTLIVGEETATAILKLENINKEIKSSITSLIDIQKAFDFIGALGDLGLSIIDKNPAAISDNINFLSDLVKEKTS
ncbi:hypothetical protein [uncultured Cyclobacterium sp.]|uniref:hypothetical protein n=1 Tax=uncultured Cyclobacterium sp. TaxID=453820 RepID=UPI0030EF63F7|tara:strand:- start:562989 stop:563399 length:411 start_codon:yes stop_codon:yes gene_type:complete